MPEHRHARRQRGFTLAEVLVATAIFAVIVIAALMIYDRSNRVFKESVEAAAMQQETRVAFDKLVRDVRMAGFDFDRDGVPMISTPTVWAASTVYAQNRVVVPTTHNGFVYIAVNGGQSGANEPTWQTTIGEITNDNTMRWRAVTAVYQQPDEQIEFAGLSAITIRGNLDYTSDADNEHGREDRTDTAVPTYDYEPADGQFPIVTTGNDEIVTYALKSDRPGAPNDDEIRFFADVARPRAAYPGSGGAPESEVVIEGVDLCDDERDGRPQCIHPPYTLYRFTIDQNGRPDAGTPVASNIRSLKFWYYTSPLGGVTDANNDGVHEEQLTDADGAVIAQGAIGGLGQYDPDNVGGTANFGDRGQREQIQAIRIQLVGMNSVQDARYTNPSETGNPEAVNFRTYQLESLIVPRNAGLRGMQEPVSTTPTPPHIRTLCHGYCYATRVTWDPPSSGGVTTYEVRYGPTWSTSNRALPNLAQMPDRASPARFPGDQLVGYVYLPPHPTPGQQWYVNVRAVNEHGITDSDTVLRSGGSINRTKPEPVSDLDATNDSTDDHEPNQITLRWPRVTRNSTADASHNTLSCTGTAGTSPSTNGVAIPAQETIRYRIWRSTDPMFDPTSGQGVVVLDAGSSTQPTITATSASWTDDQNSIFGAPPANCTRYYYRIQAFDSCRLATENDPADERHGESEVFPPLDQQGIMGYAGYRSGSAATPATPTGFRIDADNSRCRVGPNDCSITLVWDRVTTDTASPTPNTISIDKYYIERQRKVGTSGAWQSAGEAALADPEFENNSLDTAPTVTFVDTTARHHDPNDRSLRYYYQYRVRAMNCDAFSGWTAFEDYPDVCPSGSVVAVTGTFDPTTGAYRMSGGDYVSVTPAGSTTLTRVDFQLIDVGSGTEVSSSSFDAPPFIFAWQDGQDPDAVFNLVITVVQSSGCTEEHEVRLQEDAGGCPAVTRVLTGVGSGAGVAPSPYVMNGGDTIELRGPSDPAEGVLNAVSFQLFEADGTTAVGSPVVDVSAPFAYAWTDRTDGTLYRLRPSVTFDSGCTEILDDIYIRDEVCSGATTTPGGAVSGDGVAESSAWVMASGATITVNPPSGVTPERVLFDVQAVTPAGAAEATVSDTTSPFVLTWTDRTDETVYRVTITVIYSTGCQETLTRYVKDDPAACKLAVDDPNGTILRITNTDDPTAELVIRNTGTAAFILQNVDIQWNRWDAGITWSDVTFPSGDVYSINSSASGTHSVDLSPLPTGFTTAEVTVSAGAAMTLTLNFAESGNRDPIEATDIRKVCVTYTRADTGSRQYVCRILDNTAPNAVDASPRNPTTCE